MMTTPAENLDAAVQSRGIDKSVLAIAEPRRYRNKEHLRSSPPSPVWSAAESLRTRITFASRNRARSAAR